MICCRKCLCWSNPCSTINEFIEFSLSQFFSQANQCVWCREFKWCDKRELQPSNTKRVPVMSLYTKNNNSSSQVKPTQYSYDDLSRNFGSEQEKKMGLKTYINKSSKKFKKRGHKNHAHTMRKTQQEILPKRFFNFSFCRIGCVFLCHKLQLLSL